MLKYTILKIIQKLPIQASNKDVFFKAGILPGRKVYTSLYLSFFTQMSQWLTKTTHSQQKNLQSVWKLNKEFLSLCMSS